MQANTLQVKLTCKNVRSVFVVLQLPVLFRFLNFLIMVGGETFDPSFFGYAYGVVGIVEEHIVDDDAF